MQRLWSSLLFLRGPGSASASAASSAVAGSLLSHLSHLRRPLVTQKSSPLSENKLHQNIRMLGNMLGDVIQKEEGGRKTFDAIEKLRKVGREWRRQDKEAAPAVAF